MGSEIGRWTAMTAIVLAIGACGAPADTEQGTPSDAEERLVEASNKSWINLEGRVAATAPKSFLLDYGDGTVTVQMDDWDWFQEGRHLMPGDRVAVTGRVDRDLLERATLEARAVYVENLGTYFYASGRDEEDPAESTIFMVAPAGAVDATGFVTAIEGREFTMGTGSGSMRVDTSGMPDNPLDGEGDPKVRITDRVYVWGRLDVDAREPNELMADGLVVLRPTKQDDDSPSARESPAANVAAAAG